MGKKKKAGESSWWESIWDYFTDDAIEVAMVLLSLLRRFRGGSGADDKTKEGDSR